MTLLDQQPATDSAATPEALIREARELQRRRRRRRAFVVGIGLLVVGGAGFGIAGGGGERADVDLGGPLPAGIAARAADPSGGLPWGIRVIRTTRWTCVQLGRLRGDRLGLLGRDGTAGDDGRFHPFGPSTTYQARCAGDDARGHAFMTAELGAQPASGAGGGYTGMTQCQTAEQRAALRQFNARTRQDHRAAPSQSLPVCPAGDLRFVQYGLLGPQATAVTYTLNGTQNRSEPTHGPDGAYLIVGAATPATCARFAPHGVCGQPGIAPESIGGGMITGVHFRDRPACRLDDRPRLPFFAARCPRVGFVAAKPLLTDAQVAAPVTVRRIHAQRYCFKQGPAQTGAWAPATDLGPYLPCDGPVPAGEVRAPTPPGGGLIAFTWTARQPVTSRTSQYQYFINYPHNCGGEGGSTSGRIRAGERLTRAIALSTRCAKTGTVTGAIGYDPNLGPGGGDYADDTPGRGGSLLVGRFSIAIR